MAQEREIRAIGTPRECNISPPRSRARLPLVREVGGGEVGRGCWWTCGDNDF